jgi:hypothetical protein
VGLAPLPKAPGEWLKHKRGAHGCLGKQRWGICLPFQLLITEQLWVQVPWTAREVMVGGLGEIVMTESELEALVACVCCHTPAG